MKLKSEYVVYDSMAGEKISVATGKEMDNFNGLLRANETAGLILEYLQEETTEEAIVAKLLDRYDATEEDVKAGVAQVLETLRKIKALEE